MKNYKHFIITRFNIGGNPNSFSEAWYEKRIKLFKDYCFPSLLNQNCQNFSWLVYLDPDTKSIYKTEFEDLLKQCPFFAQVRYIKNTPNFNKDISSYISNVTSAGEVVMTTRLDTDDAFHQDGIYSIQQAFKKNEAYLEKSNSFGINLLNVYQLRVTPFYEIVRKKIPSNMFVTLVELKKDNSSLRGVYSYHHNKLEDATTMVNVKDGSYCLQTIHDQNKVSSLGGLPVFRTKNLSEFGFDTSEISIQKRWLGQLYQRTLNSRMGRILKH